MTTVPEVGFMSTKVIYHRRWYTDINWNGRKARNGRKKGLKKRLHFPVQPTKYKRLELQPHTILLHTHSTHLQVKARVNISFSSSYPASFSSWLLDVFCLCGKSHLFGTHDGGFRVLQSWRMLKAIFIY